MPVPEAFIDSLTENPDSSKGGRGDREPRFVHRESEFGGVLSLDIGERGAESRVGPDGTTMSTSDGDPDRTTTVRSRMVGLWEDTRSLLNWFEPRKVLSLRREEK